MTQEEFLSLSNDLSRLSTAIPLHWGNVQNDDTDQTLNMFQIHTFDELERQIKPLTENSKNYFRRRWFLWKSAQCDEHLFCMNGNLTPNPNPKDQSYDIEFNGDATLRFDVKGTVVPKNFRDDIHAVLQDPTDMVTFFYTEQSKGVRNHVQNRLFIVHHSHIHQEREMVLRCQWDIKKRVYEDYAFRISSDTPCIQYQHVKADVIFIIEHLDKTISHTFFALR